MKLLSGLPGASMSITASARLRLLLKETLREKTTTHVLETGTFHGLGSTTFIAEAFPNERPPEAFVTIEANWVSWKHAKRNLGGFSFVKPLWGRTIPVKRALVFIESDDFLHNHRKYPDIYIDDIKDPIRFYGNEVEGKLGGTLKHPTHLLRWPIDRLFSYAGDNLLEKYVCEFRSTEPLIVLDSAGGIGFLEFSIVEEEMREHQYLLLLDDINHIKHYRSYRHIKADSQFTLIGEDEHEGWLLASHIK